MAREKDYDIIIIGGGASGMMAGSVAAQDGKKVLLLEKNSRLGEKLSISGGGRCNITNNEDDIHVLLQNYGESGKFLYSAFTRFGVKETFKFFEKLKLPLVVEARKRVFPASQKATDVLRVLNKSLKTNGVDIRTNTKVTKIEASKDKIVAVHAGKGKYTAHSYVLATGGVSHPETGSTGDGFSWLAKLGHTIVPPTPTIVPLQVKEEWVHKLSGVSLSFMKITFFVNEKKSFSEKGKILFTHFGISGPLILNSAGKVSDLLQEGEVTAHIDCFPDTDHGALEKRLLKVFDNNKNKKLKNVFDEIAPHGTDGVLLTIPETVDPEKSVHSVTKEERKNITHLLKALPITITGLMGYDRAVVADGGVPLTEIDTKTMRSKIFDNLFITGDLLHINRPSGGFSLQLCWTTGFLAGKQ